MHSLYLWSCSVSCSWCLATANGDLCPSTKSQNLRKTGLLWFHYFHFWFGFELLTHLKPVLVDSTNFKRSVILVKNLPPSVVLVYYPIWPTLCGVQIFFNSIAVMRSDNVNSILQYVEDSLQHYPKQTVQFHHDSAVLRIHPEPTNMHHARKQSILSQKNNNMLTW